MAGRFTVESVFKAIDQISGPVRKMRAQVAGFSDSAVHKLSAVDTTFSKMTGTIKTGAVAIGAAFALFAAGAVQAKDVGVEFEQTLVNAASKFPEAIKRGTAEFQTLENAARKVGSTTKFTASQAAQGLEYLAMAGFNANQSIAALPGVVDLATAATMDLGAASDAATDILGAFNLTSKDSAVLGANLARVNDVLAKTSTSTNTSVSQMYEAIKQSGAAAAASGTQIEQYSAMLGVLANSGTKGSEAGNALKNVFTSLMAPSAGAEKTLKKLNVRVADSKGNMRDTVDILKDFNKAVSKMGNVKKMATINEIFGKDYVAPTSVLLRDINQVESLDESLKKATGSASKMAAAMGDTTKGRELTLSSGFEGNQISFFKAIQKPYEKFLDTMIKVVRETDKWINANRELIQGKVSQFFDGLVDTGTYIVKNWSMIVDVTSAVIKGFMGFYAVMAVLKAFIITMTAVNLVMAANPIGLVIVAIGALVAAIVAWNSASDAAKAKIIAFVNDGIEYIASALSGLLKSFYEWTANLGVLGKVLDLAVSSAVGAFSGLLSLPMDIYNNWNNLPEYFKGLLGSVVDYFLDKFAQVKAIYSDIVSMFTSSEKIKNQMGSDLIGPQQAINYNMLNTEFGSGSGNDEKPSAQIISPSERVSKQISESRSTSSSTLTIEDRTGTAALTGDKNENIKLKIATSGGF